MTLRERAALTIAARPYRHQGARETDLRRHTGWTPARAYQVVDALLDRHEALAEMPLEVSRLRRLRDKRRAARTATTPPHVRP